MEFEENYPCHYQECDYIRKRAVLLAERLSRLTEDGIPHRNSWERSRLIEATTVRKRRSRKGLTGRRRVNGCRKPLQVLADETNENV
jgi:hypothetical protein